MIVLDTNVVSELMRPSPATNVVTWFSRRRRTDFYVTSITYAEVLFGIARLSPGRRRNALIEAAEAMFSDDFSGRILSFEPAMAKAYAEIARRRELTGRKIGAMDGLIAAIASSYGASIATRDRDFFDCGIDVFDPWNDQ